jgi:hypothetical protein
MAVLMIFVFTALMFIVYDCLVEWRQSVVMDSAAVKHTSLLVHELYPPEFINRVIQPHGKNASTLPNGDQKRTIMAVFEDGLAQRGVYFSLYTPFRHS